MKGQRCPCAEVSVAMSQIESFVDSEGMPYGNSELGVMAFTHFANHVYMQMHLALIPVFMKEFDLSLGLIGVMVMIPILSEAITTIPAGLIADKLGYSRQVRVSLGLTAGAAILMTQASNVYYVVLSLSLLALSTTIYHPPAYGAVSQMFQVNRNRALGIHGAGGTLGWALGPLSIGALLGVVGWRLVYLVWVPPTLLCIFLLMRMRLPDVKPSAMSPAKPESLKSMFTVSFSTVLAMIAINSMGRQIVSTLMSPYIVLVRGFSVQTASYIIGLVSLTGIVAAPLGGIFADRLGEKRWLTLTLTSSLLALVGLTSAGTMEQLFLLGAVYGYLVHSGMGATAALVSHFTPMARRGLGYALFFLPSYISGAVAPVIATTLAESHGMWTSFSLAAMLLITGIMLLRKVPRTK